MQRKLDLIILSTSLFLYTYSSDCSKNPVFQDGGVKKWRKRLTQVVAGSRASRVDVARIFPRVKNGFSFLEAGVVSRRETAASRRFRCGSQPFVKSCEQ